MSKYQKKASQNVQRKITAVKKTSANRNSIQKSSYQHNSNAFRVFTLICVVIGVSVFIGLSAEGNNNNTPPPSTYTSPPTSTTTSQTTTSTTAYKIPYSVKTIESTTIPLSNYQGKTLLIYFTGASCIPCKTQLPYIISNYNQHKSTGKVEVVSLDIQGHSLSDLQTWKQDNGITWAVCQDTNYQLSSYYSVQSMPTLLVIDKEGNKINQYVGAQSEATINAIFQTAIA